MRIKKEDIIGEIDMRPENAPVFKGKCGKEFIERIEQPLNAKQKRLFEKADEVYRAIKPR